MKKDVIKTFPKSLGKKLFRVSVLMQLGAWGLQLYQKKQNRAQGFPVSFAKFQEHLPLYNSSSGCFWKAKGLKAEYKLILQM